MKEYLSSSDISNEMSMMRSVFKGTFLVVEGATDCRLYGKFVDRENVRIIVAHSKNNVVNSVSEMDGRRRDARTIGFVDRDMDGLLGKKRSPPIFQTDRRDMETSILSTSALRDVLSEYADQEKLRNFEDKYGDISKRISDAAVPIGALMYISYRKGMNLSFKDLDFSVFIDSRSLAIDISRLVAEVYNISMAQRYPRAAITEQLRNMVEDIDDPWNIARGHDAVSILRIGLRFSFGSYNARSINDNEIGGALRLAYGRGYFTESDLYRNSLKWTEEHNLALWAPEKERINSRDSA